MKYTVEVEIEAPRERVVALMDDPDNLPKWMEGLRAFEHLEGERGRVGARSKLVFEVGARRFDMLETITARDLPDVFAGTYDVSGVRNLVVNRFVDLGGGRTRWVSENEFRFSGLMKLMGLFMRGAFPKQTRKYLEAFKAFAEHGTDVRDRPSSA